MLAPRYRFENAVLFGAATGSAAGGLGVTAILESA
jgi:hypothetical protein